MKRSSPILLANRRSSTVCNIETTRTGVVVLGSCEFRHYGGWDRLSALLSDLRATLTQSLEMHTRHAYVRRGAPIAGKKHALTLVGNAVPFGENPLRFQRRRGLSSQLKSLAIYSVLRYTIGRLVGLLSRRQTVGFDASSSNACMSPNRFLRNVTVQRDMALLIGEGGGLTRLLARPRRVLREGHVARFWQKK